MPSIKFNFKNYNFLGPISRNFLGGNGLFDHVVFVKPTSPAFASYTNTTSSISLMTYTSSVVSTSLWNPEVNLIMFLMISSIEPCIGITLMHLSSAKAIWDCLQHIYSGPENVTRSYHVCKQYFSLEQGNKVWQSTTLRSWVSLRRGTCNIHS
jgi:hypothetical protein